MTFRLAPVASFKVATHTTVPLQFGFASMTVGDKTSLPSPVKTTLLAQVESVFNQLADPDVAPLQRHSIPVTVFRFLPMTVMAGTTDFEAVATDVVPVVNWGEVYESTENPELVCDCKTTLKAFVTGDKFVPARVTVQSYVPEPSPLVRRVG